jgi:hypothetical protein
MSLSLVKGKVTSPSLGVSGNGINRQNLQLGGNLLFSGNWCQHELGMGKGHPTGFLLSFSKEEAWSTQGAIVSGVTSKPPSIPPGNI